MKFMAETPWWLITLKIILKFKKLPELKKIKIAEASLYDLSRIPYIKKEKSTEIIKLRIR